MSDSETKVSVSGKMIRAYGTVTAPMGTSDHDMRMAVYRHLASYPDGKTAFGKQRPGLVSLGVHMSWSHEWKEESYE